MTEISFSRAFLTALDSRPIRVSSDHTSDPRKFPNTGIYTLPKYPSSPAKRKRNAASTGAGKKSDGFAVTLTYPKSPQHGLEVDDVPAGTAVFELKERYARRWNVPVDKIKLLHSKKPVGDAKTLGDVVGDRQLAEDEEVEFTVMLMGGVTPSESAAKDKEPTQVPAAVGPSGKEMLKTDEFWSDLKGFLVQRLKDEEEGEKLASLFKKTVDSM